MNQHSLFSGVVGLVMTGALAACAGAGGDASSSDSEINKSKASVDAVGCGDGKTSTPNAWFMSVGKSSSSLFDGVVLMSSNLFSIDSVTANNPAAAAGSLDFPEDVSKTTSLIFNVSFTPGRNSLSSPTIEADSRKNRDAVLLKLKSIGAKIDCNNILRPKSGAPVSVAADLDSVGCGDGTKSAPNGWFVEFDKSNDRLFDELALAASNLMKIGTVAPVNPDANAGSLTFPEDTSKTTGFTFVETFTPGVDSIALPDVKEKSIKNRDAVLLELKADGVDIACNQIGVAKPLGQ